MLIIGYLLILGKIVLAQGRWNLLMLIIYMEALTLMPLLAFLHMGTYLDNFYYVGLVITILTILALESVIGIMLVLRYTPTVGLYELRR